MPTPMIVGLLLDAEGEFVRAADGVPVGAREAASHGLNAPGWIVAHGAYFLDVWLSADAQVAEAEWEVACDPWLLDWTKRQEAVEASGVAIETPFAEAREALDRAMERTRAFVEGLSEEDLAQVPATVAEHGWPEGTTVGYLVARAAAHLFAHASELNVVATAAGAGDMGLPGHMAQTWAAKR